MSHVPSATEQTIISISPSMVWPRNGSPWRLQIQESLHEQETEGKGQVWEGREHIGQSHFLCDLKEYSSADTSM